MPKKEKQTKLYQSILMALYYEQFSRAGIRARAGYQAWRPQNFQGPLTTHDLETANCFINCMERDNAEMFAAARKHLAVLMPHWELGSFSG